MTEPLALHPPAAVHEIAAKLRSHGYQAWAVGGALRDALLGSPAVDWDIATSARPDDVRRIFRRTIPVGVEHGTVGVLWKDGVMYEVTTFRRDVETDGRHAVVAFAETIEEDLARRDFTMNAIAWDPATGELRDPFGGIADLRNDIVRTVGEPAERFAEDYLRVLRAMRFAGQLGCTIESRTWTALQQAVGHLRRLSAERVREELYKVLGKTRAASCSLELYRASGALAELYPDLDATVGVAETEDAGDDLWQRSLRAVDAVSPQRLQVRLAALLHGIGMPAARTRSLRGGYSFVGHEAIGARKAREVLQRLKASNADIERVGDLVALQSTLFPPDAPDAGIRRWLQHVDPSRVRDLFRMRIALWRAHPVEGGANDLTERWRRAHAVMLTHPVLTTADLAIDGRDLKALGLTPGPQFGALLRTLLERVVEDPALNTKEQLTALARAELDA